MSFPVVTPSLATPLPYRENINGISSTFIPQKRTFWTALHREHSSPSNYSQVLYMCYYAAHTFFPWPGVRSMVRPLELGTRYFGPPRQIQHLWYIRLCTRTESVNF